MTEQWICPQCDQKNAETMRFCPNCGTTNPALALSASDPGRRDIRAFQGKRRVLWALAIGLWVLACAALAAAGGVWLARRDRVDKAVPTAAVAETLGGAVTAEGLASLPVSTPTSAPQPTIAATQANAELSRGGTSDDNEPGRPDDASPSAPDPLHLSDVASTATSDGIILFLSSRDHDPQTEAERRRLAQSRDLELYAMKPDGSMQTRLSNGNQGWSNYNSSLTPYHMRNQVVINGKYVFDLSTRQVVDDLSLEFENPGASSPLRGYYPTWAPGGGMTFFTGSGGGGIYYLDDVQGEPRQLTDPPDDVWGDGWPCLSPDGEWIAFARFWNDPAQDGLWLVRPDGSDLHRIIDIDTRRVFWSPDSQWLAFEGYKLNATMFSFELWVSKSDGDNLRQLTSLPEDFSAWEPRWSPDGKRIVYQGGTGWLGHIYAIDAQGGVPQQLTTAGDQNMAPLWLPISPDEVLITSNDTPGQSIQDSVSPQTSSPTPQPVIAAPICPSPGVQITSPRPGARFTQRYNYIVGTASIPRFHHWKLEYSTNPNGGWTYLFERDYPVDNDKLAMIDASTISHGPYGLRLTVVDETGNYPEPCEVWYTNAY